MRTKKDGERGWSILSNIESSKKDELGFVVETHALDVRFYCFHDLFSVLEVRLDSEKQKGTMAYLGTALSEEFPDNPASILCMDHLSKQILTATKKKVSGYFKAAGPKLPVENLPPHFFLFFLIRDGVDGGEIFP